MDNSSKDINWDEQPLGNRSDKELAQRLGVSTSTAAYQRNKRNIQPRAPRGTAKRINWSRQPLGQVSDRALAHKLGVSRGTVRLHREKRGIPPVMEAPATSSSSVKWDEQPLGKMKDAALAAKLNVTSPSVAHARKVRGIPRYSEVDETLKRAVAQTPAESTPVIVAGSTKDFEVTVKIRNNHLKQRRLELGYEALTDFARAVGISASTYSALENLRVAPKRRDGEWRGVVVKLAKFHGCGIEELFPPNIVRAKARPLVFQMDPEDLTPILNMLHEPPQLPDQFRDDKDLRMLVENALKSLMPQERRILEWRLGFHGEPLTLDEVGAKYYLSRERMRQIEAKALRKLRHPDIATDLRLYFEE